MSIKRKSHKLSRREQLYISIIGGTSLRSTVFGKDDHAWRIDRKWNTYFDTDFKEGDLIMTGTSIGRNPNIFNIGICDKKISNSEVVIKDIFTEDKCNYYNESYVSIKNVWWQLLLSNKHYKYFKTFENSCYKVDSWRFIALKPEFKKDCVLFKTRKRFGHEDPQEIHDLPYGMTAKAICEYLQGIKAANNG